MTRPRRKRFRPIVDRLDDRCLLSASPSGLSPAQIEAAYGLSTSPTTGAGRTIAIVDAYNDPYIQSELSAFDAQFGLAAATLTVEGQTGVGSRLPATDSGWAEEEALDVEWAHALAPGAKIVLVEANSENTSDLLAAVQTASKSGASVVSMSWGLSDTARSSRAQAQLNQTFAQYDGYFTTPGVTYVAAAGDSPGSEWPASSPNVVAVGGTSLSISGGTVSQTVWSQTGGGVSGYESEPSFQSAVQSSGRRTTPDVSFDANPYSGVSVYSLFSSSRSGPWLTVGGTSLGAPSWAAIIAAVDQGRGTSLSSSQTLTALYNLPSSAFSAVSGGSVTTTGLGAPSGALVSDLVNGVTKATARATTTTGVKTTTTTTGGATTKTTTTTGGATTGGPTNGGPTGWWPGGWTWGYYYTYSGGSKYTIFDRGRTV